MKKIILALITLVIAIPSWSEDTPKEIEIGIVEHLGETIDMNLTFINENDDTVSLGQLIDKPTILSFVYFDCPGLCSPLLSGIADAITHLDMKIGTEYQVITVSFNTKDTPEKAKQKKVNFVQTISQENREHWLYLTGEEENIQALTNSVGFKYKPQGLDFSHPSTIILLSPDGKITRYLYGLSFLPFDVKMAVIEAQQGISRPTINRILEYCFAYDPASRTYGLQVTRVIGVFTVFMVALVLMLLFFKSRKNPAKAD